MIEVRKTYKNLQLLQDIDDVYNICCWSQTKQSSHAVARMPKSHLVRGRRCADVLVSWHR
jgi:hypothetical protein